MTSIGEALRRERLKRNLDLEQVAHELKISVRLLKAMEDEEFDKLPGGVFTKSFLRQYGTFLGLDSAALVADYMRLTEPREPAPQFVDKPKPDVPEMPIDNFESWQTVGERRPSSSSWVTAAVIVVAVMLTCSGVVWWWERPRHPAQAQETPVSAPPVTVPSASNPPVPQSPTPAAETPPAQAEAAAVQPASTSTSPATATPPGTGAAPAATPATPSTGAVQVGITAAEAVWVRARADGKTVFAITLQPGESRSVSAEGDAELLLGNAGGANITLNGKPIAVEGYPAGVAGPKGQIRTVQFTSGGFQIVPPKVPEPPDLR